ERPVSGAWPTTSDQRHQKQHDEHHEQDLGDPRCSAGNTEEAQKPCDQGNDEKHDRVMKHVVLLGMTDGTGQLATMRLSRIRGGTAPRIRDFPEWRQSESMKSFTSFFA